MSFTAKLSGVGPPVLIGQLSDSVPAAALSCSSRTQVTSEPLFCMELEFFSQVTVDVRIDQVKLKNWPLKPSPFHFSLVE